MGIVSVASYIAYSSYSLTTISLATNYITLIPTPTTILNPANLLLGKKSWASSTLNSWSDSSKAVDGKKRCALADNDVEQNDNYHSENTITPWWMVDIGSSKFVSRVVVTPSSAGT